jgi:hypothetical protein
MHGAGRPRRELAALRDPSRLRAVRAVRDLAGADRGLVRRTLQTAAGNWDLFIIAAVFNIGTAVLAIAAMKPWRFCLIRQVEEGKSVDTQVGAAARA